jgi:hypothetical protein
VKLKQRRLAAPASGSAGFADRQSGTEQSRDQDEQEA